VSKSCNFAGALRGGTTCRPALRFQGSVAVLSASPAGSPESHRGAPIVSGYL
jgi:hypothetical protein